MPFVLSWRSRLFAAYLIGAVAALALLTLLMARSDRGWLLERERASTERLARIAAGDLLSPAAPAPPVWSGAAESLAAGLGYRVTLIDRAGRVLGDSEVYPDGLRYLANQGARPEVRAALAGAAGHDVRRSEILSEDFLYVAVPGPPGSAVAALRLARPLAEISRLNWSLTRLALADALLILAVLAALLFGVSSRQAARVKELERAAQRLGGGDLSARARELPDDEVGRLGRAFNRMAADLRSRLDALARERDEREHILARMTDGVALIDAAGHVVHANRALTIILGAPTVPEPGSPFAEFARAPALADLLREAGATDRAIEHELRLWTPHLRVVRATATRLGAAGRGSVLLVLHDLTEVELLNRVRQDFVANVSHELKTPLTSVRGYAETLLEGGLEDAEHREGFVRIIRDQAARLEAIVADLLSLAELERPGARLRTERLDLRELVERQTAVFRGRAQRLGLALAVAPGDPAPVEADRGLIDQVVANLIDNALKYTERGGVTLRVGGDDRRAWCEVEDTGPGIPAEDVPRVFERFYRVDKGRSREKGGTGLGLAIVKHVLELHGGEVAVRSAPGGGSVFRCELPRRPAQTIFPPANTPDTSRPQTSA